MNYLITHRVFAIVLSVLVLLSTFSFTVKKHYCGNNLVDVAVFSEAKDCGMEIDTMVKVEKPCCKDTVDIVEGQDELNIVTFNDLESATQLFVSSYIYTCTSLFESLPKQIIPHKDYSPPNIVKDIQLLDDVFLI
ncbi:MAG: hypothetical protein HKP48_11910 [Winogradskyella sp.]|uniref:HYC_CC_PP family protein n=1 Tax=Winogradskyella sp. TaxID=1883156 RepID=UPI001821C51E|nr:hypothetical protein [Winogradskyella sp.]MBT8244519.1 hypothetical protein [Winogradskyella sp.]NNK23961.1 hypothetical protein [Winogradskyella sp.]